MALRRRGTEYRKYLQNNSGDVLIPERTLRRWLKEGKITKARMLELGIIPRGSRRCKNHNASKANGSPQSANLNSRNDNTDSFEMNPSPSTVVGSDVSNDISQGAPSLDYVSDEEPPAPEEDVLVSVDSFPGFEQTNDGEDMTVISSKRSEEISDILESTKIGVEALNKPLKNGLAVTKFETLLMIFHLAMRHSLTDTFLTDLLQFVNVLVGIQDAIPDSMYLFRKLFLFGSEPVIHFFCPQCKIYLGPKSTFDTKFVTCENCEWLQSVSSNNEGNYFITLSIRDQLKKTLSNPELNLSSQNEQPDNVISDIFHSQLYKNLMKAHQEASALQALTVSISTDGSPVFKNGPNSLWPIHFHLNEVEPSQRFSVQNIMLGGLWFSKNCEPDIQVFLKPMVEELKELSVNGVKWKKPNGVIVESPIYLICCCADSVARPKVQCMMQFNGYYGCSYCLHPNTSFVLDELVKSQSGFRVSLNQDFDDFDEIVDTTDAAIFRRRKVLRYLMGDQCPFPYRTDKQLREHMLVASRSPLDHIYGVKSVSVLCELPYFNMVFGLPIDYMHSCLLGCMKRLASLWFDRSSHGLTYYIGLKIDRVNENLSHICTPSNITHPRPMTDRAHWKAKEWRSFLLYYGLPCLSGILPDLYYNHFKKFATAIHILTRESIEYQEIDQANGLLYEFVQDYQHLYGKINMVFNVHSLTHLAMTVKKLGPLWAYSMFPFESANGRLIKLVKGTRSISVQLAHKYLMIQNVSDTLCGSYSVSDPILDYCCKVVEYKYLKHSTKLGCVELLGKSFPIQLSFAEKTALIDGAGIQTQTIQAFNRATMKGVIYSSQKSGRQKVHNDSCVRLQNGSFCMIDWIMMLEQNSVSQAWCLVREINIALDVSNRFPPFIKQCSLDTFGSVKAVQLLDIANKCLFISVSDKNYVAEFTNLYEKS